MVLHQHAILSPPCRTGVNRAAHFLIVCQWALSRCAWLAISEPSCRIDVKYPAQFQIPCVWRFIRWIVATARKGWRVECDEITGTAATLVCTHARDCHLTQFTSAGRFLQFPSRQLVKASVWYSILPDGRLVISLRGFAGTTLAAKGNRELTLIPSAIGG